MRKSAQRVVARLSEHDLGDVDSVQLLCMGDLHVGDAQCDLDMIRAAVDWLKEPNRYAVIAGDLLNAALRDSVSDIYAEAMNVGNARKTLEKLLAPVSDRILAVVSGNHDRRVNKAIGDDLAEVLCANLGMRYYGPEAFLTIKVGWWRHQSRNEKRSAVAYTCYLAHGYAGGRLMGGKVNALKRMAEVVSADLYVTGHTHTPIALPDVHWVCDAHHGSVTEQQRMFVTAGASLNRLGGYAAAYGYPALAKVWPVVTLDGREKRMTATL